MLSTTTKYFTKANNYRFIPATIVNSRLSPLVLSGNVNSNNRQTRNLDSRNSILRSLVTTSKALKKKIAYPGALKSEYTHNMVFKSSVESIPTYQMMDFDGKVIDQEHKDLVDKDLGIKMYKTMMTLNAMDQVLYEAQRQGRISFYMTSFGEEGIVGSAAAMDPNDPMFGQYRESGALLFRGFNLDQVMNQCFSNDLDKGKGRQMPVHYGSKQHRFHTISSPLATQLPQAAGAAYALKRSSITTTPNSNGKEDGQCVICYFGEGAASEGDFHSALNMAATLECPIIFFCRNNGYAISTPSVEQYKGDGVASRGIGYGIDTIRVDGNDVWAVYAATLKAREIVVTQNKPILIESMSYRVGHHSTSDDSSAYRPKKEVEDWNLHDNPLTRMRKWLTNQGWWNDEVQEITKKQIRADVLKAFGDAEARKKPSIPSMFEDVYDCLPQSLVEQKNEIMELVRKYPDYYRVHDFAKEQQ